MKSVLRGVLLGVILQGSAHAAEPTAPADPIKNLERGKAAVVQQTPTSDKKSKSAPGKVKSAGAKKSGKLNEATAKGGQDRAADVPAETSEQTVQLKGVRG